MTPKAFFIRNHSASELHSADLSALHTISQRPKFANKQDYAAWCHDSSTSHVFYTLVEPEFPGQRSSGKNPIKFLHGIVCDYDGAPEAINATLATLKFAPGKAPAWVTTTFSGKARLIWVFERPVPVFTPEVLEKFLRILKKDFKLGDILPGLDEGALITNPHTPYELGTEWRQPYGDARIPNSVVMLALHDASDRAKWKVDGPIIPLEAVLAEVNKRWPGRWVGPFVEGARGVRFWDSKADNQTGCTTRKDGVQAWTGEAKFIPWVELLGNDFVKEYRANRIGGAIDGTYFDGMSYWRRDEKGIWRDLSSEMVKRHLNVIHALSAETKKGGASEVAQAVTTIDTLQRVDGAFPCLFMKDDIVRDGSQTFLNVSRVRPIPHSGSKPAWGYKFPWLAEYLTGLFGEEQLQVFLSWLSHFYKNAAAGTPRRGQALFIAGEKSTGKTLLNQRIIGGLMGGFQEATAFVLGQTSFNESLFFSPVWSVDDAVGSTDAKMHNVYSQMVKKIVANPYLEYHPKFKKAVTQRFNGRLIVTLNDDPSSIMMLPQIEGTLLDKVVALHASPPGVSFAGVEEIITAELPYFAEFVGSFVTPDWMLTNPDEVARFGHNAFMHPRLLEIAKEASPSFALLEAINVWRTHYFRGCEAKEWTGSAIDLHIAMANDEVLNKVLGKVIGTRNAFSRDLQNLVRQGTSWVSYRRTSAVRFYAVSRPENL